MFASRALACAPNVRRAVAARASGDDGTVAPDVGLTKRGKPKPKPQKPRQRKPKGPRDAPADSAPPSAADVEASSRYDDIVARGGVIYEVFARAAGPNQWFPVGPLAVENRKRVKQEIWNAEEPLRKAAFKMYPALAKPPAFGRLEYGYRERDEASKITEAEIREKKGERNPFDDVILLTRDDDSTTGEEENVFAKFANSVKRALNPYDDK